MRLCARLIAVLAMASPLLAQRPSFDVASVKPASGMPTGLNSGRPTPDPEHFIERNVPLGFLIRLAYGLEDYQFSGPSVLDSRFDVQASAALGSNKEQVNLMLQSLLEERFHLRFHYVIKEVSAYNMVVGKGGLKLKDSVPLGRCAGPGRPTPGTPPCPPASDEYGIARSKVGGPGMMVLPGGSIGHIALGRNVDMKALARDVHFQLTSPVFDKTGIEGTFDIRMEFASTTAPDDTPHPDIATALDRQLGLKLQPIMVSVQVMIVDHADGVPTAN